MSDQAPDGPDSGWDRGWDEHKRRQLIRMSKLTMAQKLQWLEDMQVLYEKLSQSRRKAIEEGQSGAKGGS